MKKIILILLVAFSNNIDAQCLNKISSGNYHSIGLKPNGTIYSWGNGSAGWGSLGMGNDNDVLEPTQVGTTTNWQKIFTGSYNSFAIKSDGTLWGCGNNETGELGIGTFGVGNAPHSFVQVGTANNWNVISANFQHTLGLKTDGTLWSWGINTNGQLGDGTITDHYVPMQVGTANDWVKIAASGSTSFGIKSNGTMWSWGFNGALGIGSWNPSSSSVPVLVGATSPECGGAYITDWQAVYTGPGNNVVLGIRSNGKLYSWGGIWITYPSVSGAMGTGPGVLGAYCPQQIGTDSNWATAAVGWNNGFGIKTNGTLWAWGQNDKGQLGDGTTVDKGFPVQVGTDTNWASVSAGTSHTVALKTDGSLWSWGDGTYGQQPVGSYTSSLVPVQIAVAGCTLGTEDFDLNKNSFKISPNPAKGTMNLFYNENLDFNNIAVYDMSGRQVLTANVIDNGNSTSVNIDNLKQGVYVVVLQNGTISVVQEKLVLE